MNQRGFSLLETMVALSVFSVSAMGLLSLNTLSVRTSGELDTRLLAGVVAGNVAVDTVTGAIDMMSPVSSGEDTQRNRNYVWTRTIEPTPRANLYSIQIEVAEPGSDTVLARLSTLAHSRPAG